MTFRLADVKKTLRSRRDGERYLHPKLLDPELVSGQVGLALAYFQARLGRARRELDGEVLVRFFGDPKIAQGVVACLSDTYRWRTQTFAEVLDPATVTWLERRSLSTPEDLRLYLFDTVNATAAGFLPYDRAEHLLPLARRLRLTPAKLDQLVALDAPEHAILVRAGPVPEPADVIARYNFQAVDAVLRNSAALELDRIGAAAQRALAAACVQYGVVFQCDDNIIRLRNRADAFGSYARWGGRLTRALYTAATVEPALLGHGRAGLAWNGKSVTYLLERATLRALAAGANAALSGGVLPELVEAWAKRRPGSGGGWRLVAMPDPVAHRGAGLILAPLACRRDDTVVYLWRVETPAHLDQLQRVCATGLPILAIAGDGISERMPSTVPHARIGDGVAGLIGALSFWWGSTRADAAGQALDGLLEEVVARGFVAEVTVAQALGCASADELPHRLRTLDPARGAYVPGIGLCSPSFASNMRKGLRRKPHRKPAA